MELRQKIFQTFARLYPTDRMSEREYLAFIFRMLFYALRPTKPFVMRLANYKCLVKPEKASLTRVLIRRGYWEKFVSEVFVDVIRKISPDQMSVVVDAGANFGHYSLSAAAISNQGTDIFSFEPHPVIYGDLVRNVELNQLPNVHPVNAGLAAFNGEMTLFADDKNPGGHSFLQWNREGVDGGAHQVPVMTLDAFLASRVPGKKLCLLKIDVQGFELDVLQGAEKTVARDRPYILCEVTPKVLEKRHGNCEPLLNFFEKYRYVPHLFAADRAKMTVYSYRDLAHFLNNTDHPFFDVLFEPAQP